MIKNLLLVATAIFTFSSAQAGGFTILNATPPGPFTGGTTGHKIKFYVKEVAGSPPAEAFVNLLGTAIGTYKTGGTHIISNKVTGTFQFVLLKEFFHRNIGITAEAGKPFAKHW